MEASNTAPTEPKSGVKIHWQSSIRTSADVTAYLCMNEFGADVFFKPMLKNGQPPISVEPKIARINYSPFKSYV
jgi:hypothetical protein